MLIEQSHKVVAEISDSREILKTARELHPDLMSIDLRMPPTYTDDGLRAAIEVRTKITPKIPLLILSHHIESFYASLLLDDDQTGIGYLLKDRVTNINESMASLDEMANGGTILDPDAVNSLMHSSKDETLQSLNVREREILVFMAEGKSNNGISTTIFITEGAVEKHVSNILNKLGHFNEETNHRRVLVAIRYLNR